MRADVRRTLVAYDITDDRRRTRVANVLLGYGDRVQYSVFVVDASPVRLDKLRRRLFKEADLKVDSLLFCDLGAASTAEGDRFVTYGRGRHLTTEESFIV